MSFARPEYLGSGVGLRYDHYDDFLLAPDVAWVEVISENFMDWETFSPQSSLDYLLEVRKLVPVALHGVSMSVGSELDPRHLKALKKLIDIVNPHVVSDHLCWAGFPENNLHDLLPLPYTNEAIQHVVDNIKRAQDFLQRQILIENLSSYVEFESSQMPEWEFLATVAEKADCGLLVDLNNIYVSSVNHRFSVLEYLKAIPRDRIGHLHLAGHSNRGSYLLDTHDNFVCPQVWEIFRWSKKNWGNVNAMIEWDNHIPSWANLLAEVAKLDSVDANLPSALVELQ